MNRPICVWFVRGGFVWYFVLCESSWHAAATARAVREHFGVPAFVARTEAYYAGPDAVRP